MFQRIPSLNIRNAEFWDKDPDFRKANELYNRSIALQKAGDPQGSTECYLQALDLQAQLKSIPPVTTADLSLFPQSDGKIDYNLSLLILKRMNLRELVHLTEVCRTWQTLSLDGSLWMELYRERWPIAANIEVSRPDSRNTDCHMKDWYLWYKHRHCADKNFQVTCTLCWATPYNKHSFSSQVVFCDIGYNTTTYGALGYVPKRNVSWASQGRYGKISSRIKRVCPYLPSEQFNDKSHPPKGCRPLLEREQRVQRFHGGTGIK
jgi:hypothetical protein